LTSSFFTQKNKSTEKGVGLVCPFSFFIYKKDKCRAGSAVPHPKAAFVENGFMAESR
jgi:hypothetical protein